MTEKNQTQVNIETHQQTQFEAMIQQGLTQGGIHFNASKNHGKTRLMFSCASELMKNDSVRTIIYDGSESWLYGFSRIAVFNIAECDIQATENKTIMDIERYELTNWNLLKLALTTQKDLLIRLKTKSPSKRGYAIRAITNYLDVVQRKECETSANHKPKQSIAYIIEEFENAFSSRSSLRLDAEIFMTTFNEARNFSESFWTSSQRENDCSKTMRVKQLMCYGKIPECDKSPYHRRLERQYNVNFSTLQQRNWFFEGQTFQSPTWTQSGKPTIINRTLRSTYNQKQPLTQNQKWQSYNPLKKFFLLALSVMTAGQATSQQPIHENSEEKDEIEILSDSDSNGDGLETLDSEEILFPENDI